MRATWCALLCLCATIPAHADKGTGGSIVSVDASRHTLTIAARFHTVSRGEQTFTLNDQTEIRIDDRPATLAELKPGMEVRIIGTPRAPIASLFATTTPSRRR